MLALEVLSKLPEVIDMESYKDTPSEKGETQATGPEVKVESVGDLDWSQPVYTREEQELELQWSEHSEDSDGEGVVENKVEEEVSRGKGGLSDITDSLYILLCSGNVHI